MSVAAGRGLVLIVALLLTACVTPEDGQFLCAAPGAACPSGMACVEGVCRTLRDAAADAAPVDAALVDAAPVDAQRDAGTCESRGLLDEDGDGWCEGAGDCDDAAADVQPGGTERCEALAEGRDDDCDGAIDEGCPLTIGFVHAPIALHQPASTHFGPELSADGLRVYVVAADLGARGALYVAERPALDQPFGAATIVPGTLTDVILVAATITGDELELFAQGARSGEPSRIWHASRLTRTAAFGPLEVVDATEDLASEQVHPSVSRDGLELIYVRVAASRELWRVSRTDRTAPLANADTTGLTGEHPRLSTDGLTLRYTSPSMGLVAASRATRAAPFGAPAPEPGLAALGPARFVFHHPRAREVWLTLEGSSPRTPLPTSMMRVQVCRAESCGAVPPIACDTASGAIRSTDGMRCYRRGEMAGAVGFAWDRCMTDGSARASLHTAEDVDDVRPLLTSALWLGLVRTNVTSEWTWSSGEPFLWPAGLDPRWGAGEPSAASSDTYASIRPDGTWDALAGTGSTLFALCEREQWPIW